MKKLLLLSLFSLTALLSSSMYAMENIRLIKLPIGIPEEIAYFSAQQEDLTNALRETEQIPRLLHAYLRLAEPSPETPYAILPAVVTDIISDYALPCDGILESSPLPNNGAQDAHAANHAEDEVKEAAEKYTLPIIIKKNLQTRLKHTSHILEQLQTIATPLPLQSLQKQQEIAQATAKLIQINIDTLTAEIAPREQAIRQAPANATQEQLDLYNELNAELRCQQMILRRNDRIQKIIIRAQESIQEAEQQEKEQANQQAEIQQKLNIIESNLSSQNLLFSGTLLLGSLTSNIISKYINSRTYLSKLFKERLTQEACPAAFVSSLINYLLASRILNPITRYFNTPKSICYYIALDLAHKYGEDLLCTLIRPKKQKKAIHKLQPITTISTPPISRLTKAKNICCWGLKTALTGYMACEQV